MGKKIIIALLSLVGDMIILHPEAESYTLCGRSTIVRSSQTTDDFNFLKDFIQMYLIYKAGNKMCTSCGCAMLEINQIVKCNKLLYFANRRQNGLLLSL